MFKWTVYFKVLNYYKTNSLKAAKLPPFPPATCHTSYLPPSTPLHDGTDVRVLYLSINTQMNWDSTNNWALTVAWIFPKQQEALCNKPDTKNQVHKRQKENQGETKQSYAATPLCYYSKAPTFTLFTFLKFTSCKPLFCSKQATLGCRNGVMVIAPDCHPGGLG